MTATHELQQLVDARVCFSLALEHNGWFSIRIGNYLSRRFATNYSPTFELAVAALTRAAFGWPNRQLIRPATSLDGRGRRPRRWLLFVLSTATPSSRLLIFLHLSLEIRDSPFQFLALAPLVFRNRFVQLFQGRASKLRPRVHENLRTSILRFLSARLTIALFKEVTMQRGLSESRLYPRDSYERETQQPEEPRYLVVRRCASWRVVVCSTA